MQVLVIQSIDTVKAFHSKCSSYINSHPFSAALEKKNLHLYRPFLCLGMSHCFTGFLKRCNAVVLTVLTPLEPEPSVDEFNIGKQSTISTCRQIAVWLWSTGNKLCTASPYKQLWWPAGCRLNVDWCDLMSHPPAYGPYPSISFLFVMSLELQNHNRV